MTLTPARQPLSPTTVNMVAGQLQLDGWRTPREIEALLSPNLARPTVRAALLLLRAAGRAEVSGDINQRFYRARAEATK